MKKSFINQDEFPLVIEPNNTEMTTEDCYEWLRKERASLTQQLLKYGALLFRRFPVHNTAEFSEFITSLGLGQFIDYVGGDSPRNKIQGGVYTSTEAPPSLKIPLHNELSFVKNYPRHIYFFCEIAPKENGETIIADARKVYRAVNQDVKQRLHDKGIKYLSSYYHKSQLMEWLNKFQRSHKSWPEVFETTHKEEVEKKCIENEFAFRWKKDDWIQINQFRPAFIEHPETKEQVWFNQIHLYDFNPKLLGIWRYLAAKVFYIREHTRLHEVSYADETKIPRSDIYHIMDTLDEQTVRFPWQKGDVLVLDNVLAMHGRAPFTGKRRILAAMTS
jgi:alpha-ketoglutarate-dependent taurine dioxygenase